MPHGLVCLYLAKVVHRILSTLITTQSTIYCALWHLFSDFCMDEATCSRYVIHAHPADLSSVSPRRQKTLGATCCSPHPGYFWSSPWCRFPRTQLVPAHWHWSSHILSVFYSSCGGGGWRWYEMCECDNAGTMSQELALQSRRRPQSKPCITAKMAADFDEEMGRQSKSVFLDLFGGTGRVGKAAMLQQPSLGSLKLDINCGWDLTDADLVRSIIHAVRQGHVRALMLAPPCNTWSRARRGRRKSKSNRGWPLAVRNNANIWGLPAADLSLKARMACTVWQTNSDQ